MKTAQQARSRATEARILDAAESLLVDRPFDDLTIAGIADRAGVSVGGFYARFERKESLLDALHERYEERRTRRLEAAFAIDRWQDREPADRVRGVVSEVVELMSEERHVLRTFLLRYWARPDEVPTALAQRLDELYGSARRILLFDRDRMRVDDPEEAARAALGIVMGACRDILVMKRESVPGHPRLSRDRLIDYLTAAALGMLGLASTGPGAKERR